MEHTHTHTHTHPAGKNTGVGRLGLCLALVMERAGYDVLGVDVFPGYVDSLNSKTFRSNEPRVNEFLDASTKFRATTSLEEGLAHSDFLYVMVATPSGGGEKFYDHSHVSACLCWVTVTVRSCVHPRIVGVTPTTTPNPPISCTPTHVSFFFLFLSGIHTHTS